MSPVKTQTLIAVAFVVVCPFLPAQAWDRARAVAEITELTTRQWPRAQWPERAAKMQAWLERVERTKLDLGDHAFTRAIPHYFNGDHERAGKELFHSLSKQSKLPTDRFDTYVGRILLLHARNTIQEGNLDLTRKVVALALKYYPDPRVVYRVVASTLKHESSEASTKFLNELLAGMLVDRRLSDSARQELLAGLYRDPRRRAAGARRARASTIKPFDARSIDGQKVSIRELVGKVVLVDFWATWCGPCIRKMPDIVKAHEKFRDDGLVVIGVSLDKEPAQKRGGELIEPDPEGETTKKIRTTMHKLGMNWPVVYEGGGWETRLAKENGIRAIPATFLIDREGKVRYSNLGQDLEKRIRELLDEGRQRRRF